MNVSDEAILGSLGSLVMFGELQRMEDPNADAQQSFLIASTLKQQPQIFSHPLRLILLPNPLTLNIDLLPQPRMQALSHTLGFTAETPKPFEAQDSTA